jgi:anti-sigma regulatory factor (Ser/Thr protein kinase)
MSSTHGTGMVPVATESHATTTGPDGVGIAVRRFTAEPASARMARRWAAGVARDWGMAEVETLALLTSELATNAVVHAKSEFEVTLTIGLERVRVEVADSDPRVPVVLTMSIDGTAGRGLGVVQALATAWGFAERTPGKAVWFELPAFRR